MQARDAPSVAPLLQALSVLVGEFMSQFYTMKKGVYPTDEQVAETRRKAHAEHLDYSYGDHWSIFEDKEYRCFIEFDVGHFASEFIIREISRDDYSALKNDKSLFTNIIKGIT